jgi:hypothetical protein
VNDTDPWWLLALLYGTIAFVSIGIAMSLP